MVGQAGTEQICKVGDFGLLRALSQGVEPYLCRSDVQLPVRWMAPESVEGSEFSTTSDVWSFGVVLWEMYNPSVIPYDTIKDTIGVIIKISKGLRLPIPEGYPLKVQRIMKACWQTEPRCRPSFISIAQLLTSVSFTAIEDTAT